MNLYRISQTVNNDYDTYDSAVVCAADEAAARAIHPGMDEPCRRGRSSWCVIPDEVTAELIGTAAPGLPEGVVVASFNRG